MATALSIVSAAFIRRGLGARSCRRCSYHCGLEPIECLEQLLIVLVSHLCFIALYGKCVASEFQCRVEVCGRIDKLADLTVSDPVYKAGHGVLSLRKYTQKSR